MWFIIKLKIILFDSINVPPQVPVLLMILLLQLCSFLQLSHFQGKDIGVRETFHTFAAPLYEINLHVVVVTSYHVKSLLTTHFTGK